MLTAIVNKIIPFSCVDGPGNRTAVFLQGCNINCKYCHNPETRGVCRSCGICAEKCPAGALRLEEGNCSEAAGEDGTGECEKAKAGGPGRYEKTEGRGTRRVIWDPEKCCQCDTCIHVCPHDSSPRVRVMTPEQVFGEVKKQIPYIRGISVSGGECMLHPDFLTELFRLAKGEGLGTLIDSNGTIDFEPFPELLEVTDGVMLDIKAFDRQQFIDVTDFPNDVVLKNAKFLGERGKIEEVRFVIVPDLYDTESSVRKAGRFLLPFYRKHPFLIKLIAFRPMGVREQYRHYQVPSRGYLEKLEKILTAQGYEKIVLI